jgi:hypothetical protein
VIPVGEALDDFHRRLLAREIEEELLDVLNLQRALLEPVLLDQIFDGHPQIIIPNAQLPTPKGNPSNIGMKVPPTNKPPDLLILL